MKIKRIQFLTMSLIIGILEVTHSYGGSSDTSLAKKIGSRTLPFFDVMRNRPLIAELFYPIDNDAEKVLKINSPWKRLPQTRNAPFPKKSERLPLILFSHGDGGSRIDSAWFAESLAQRGYLVASVDHYANTWYLNLPEIALKRWERAKDISFVLRKLLRNREIGKRIDSGRIGFAGFSLGGTTGIWLAGGRAYLFKKPLQSQSEFTELALGSDQEMIDQIDYGLAKKSYADPLMRAFFLMAPGYGSAFDEVGLKEIQAPVMIVTGEADEVLPVNENAKRFSKWITGSVLKILPGKIGHAVFLNEANDDGKKSLNQRIATDDPSVSRGKIHDEVGRAAAEFFKASF